MAMVVVPDQKKQKAIAGYISKGYFKTITSSINK